MCRFIEVTYGMATERFTESLHERYEDTVGNCHLLCKSAHLMYCTFDVQRHHSGREPGSACELLFAIQLQHLQMGLFSWWVSGYVHLAQALLPTSINYSTGGPGGGQITMGALADSYYEYLLKVSPLTFLLRPCMA